METELLSREISAVVSVVVEVSMLEVVLVMPLVVVLVMPLVVVVVEASAVVLSANVPPEVDAIVVAVVAGM